MGPEQLGGVMDIVFRQAMERSGQVIDEKIEKMAEMRKAKMIAKIEEQSSAYYTSSRMIDDAILDPRDTRNVIGFCLSVIHNSEIKGGNLYGVSRM